MDLVLAILFDFFAKKVFSVEVMLLLREGDAGRVDRGGCTISPSARRRLIITLAPFAMILRLQRHQEFLQPL